MKPADDAPVDCDDCQGETNNIRISGLCLRHFVAADTTRDEFDQLRDDLGK